MSALEQDLAQTMAAFAEGAPDDLGLLSRVQAGTARRSRQRRFGAVAGATVAVAAVAVVAIVLPGTSTKSADRFTDPTGFLVDSRDLEVRFPLTPTYLPPGIEGEPQLAVTGGAQDASWLFGSNPDIQAVFALIAPTSVALHGTLTTVGDTKAITLCSPGECRLAWTRGPSQFVTLIVSTSGTEANALTELHRIADGLVDRDIVHRPQLVLGLAPASGCLLNDPSGLHTSMNPVGRTGWCPSAQVLSGQELTDAKVADGVGETVTLGGHDGWLTDSANGYRAVLVLSEGRRLVVDTPRDNGWNRDELERFVAAILIP